MYVLSNQPSVHSTASLAPRISLKHKHIVIIAYAFDPLFEIFTKHPLIHRNKKKKVEDSDADREDMAYSG